MASGTRRHFIVAVQLNSLEGAGLAANVCLGSKSLVVPAIRVYMGWIHGTQVMRIIVRRSTTDAGVWENPGRQFQGINQMSQDVGQLGDFI